MDDRDFEPRRILWLAPLTVGASLAAVLATRWAGLNIITRPPHFDPLGVAPTIIDTVVLVTVAMFVFVGISGFAGHPRRVFRIVAFVALLVSFAPDLLIVQHGSPWPPVLLLMAEHVAAWLVTVELLTRVA